METVKKPLKVFGRTLPISITRNEYTELSRDVTVLSRDELRSELMQKVFLYEKNFLPECEILSREITENEKDGTLTLSVAYRLKGDITSQMEILMK